MQNAHDRRDEQNPRVPVRVAVELGEGDFRDAFAADSLNVSKRGISMRSHCLPDIGSRLLCRLQCTDGAEPITAQGEVVWAQLDGESSGEFGLAFLDLDAKTEWMLDELLAEHGSPESNPENEPSAPIAKLELEGSPEPIAARMASQDHDSAVFEQELDLLSLGRAVRAHAVGIAGRAGSIAAVELRLVGNIPMLAVTVDFRNETEYGEVELGASDAVPRDTETDLEAPDHDRHAHITVTEFDAKLGARAEATSAPRRAAWGELQRASAPQAVAAPAAKKALVAPSMERPVIERAALPSETTLAAPEPKAVNTASEDKDFSRSVTLPISEDDDYGPDFEALTTPTWRVIAAAVWHTLGVYTRDLRRQLEKTLPHLRLAYLQVTKTSRVAYGEYVAPQIGALRRLVLGKVASRRRRTTAAPGVERGGLLAQHGRTLGIGALVAVAAGLTVYALAPSGEADAVELRPQVTPPASQAPAVEPASAAAPSARSALPTPRSAEPTAAVPTQLRAAPNPTLVPSSARVPEASPFAVDVRDTASVRSNNAPRKLRFGAAEVPRGRRFSLRMSAPVQGLQGTSDAGGFSVALAGCLSLDRAGPISASIKAVERAMIINRGDRAELSIRFANGKRPAYQVTAEGSMVYLLIEDL